MNNRVLRTAFATSLFIHCTSFLCSTLGAAIAFLFWHFGIFPFEQPWLFAIFPIISSFIIGSLLTLTAGRPIVRYIKSIHDALHQVAEGNYNTELNEKTPILELREINHSFNTMTKELASTEMLRNDFIENVSHEFKTPLTAIEGYATLLQQKNLSGEKRQEYTQKILHNTRRLNTLTGNILLLSRLENREIEIQKESYSLDEQIRESILLLEPIWNNKQLELSVEIEDCFCVANRELLAHVWQNIFGNAVKFTPVGGTVSVTLRQENGNVIVCIADNGPGMSDDARKRAFEKFYQGDTSRSTTGNGLGLSLAKRIIDLHNGTIEIDSRQEYGSIFTITLPKGAALG